jgi:hypothetical protein
VNECDINKCIISPQSEEGKNFFKELWYEPSMTLYEDVSWQKKNKKLVKRNHI